MAEIIDARAVRRPVDADSETVNGSCSEGVQMACRRGRIAQAESRSREAAGTAEGDTYSRSLPR